MAGQRVQRGLAAAADAQRAHRLRQVHALQHRVANGEARLAAQRVGQAGGVAELRLQAAVRLQLAGQGAAGRRQRRHFDAVRRQLSRQPPAAASLRLQPQRPADRAATDVRSQLPRLGFALQARLGAGEAARHHVDAQRSRQGFAVECHLGVDRQPLRLGIDPGHVFQHDAPRQHRRGARIGRRLAAGAGRRLLLLHPGGQRHQALLRQHRIAHHEGAQFRPAGQQRGPDRARLDPLQRQRRSGLHAHVLHRHRGRRPHREVDAPQLHGHAKRLRGLLLRPFAEVVAGRPAPQAEQSRRHQQHQAERDAQQPLHSCTHGALSQGTPQQGMRCRASIGVSRLPDRRSPT